MKTTLLSALVCPLDHTPLILTVSDQHGDIIEAGTLSCPRCGETYAIRNGLPYMLSPRLPRIDSKLGEVHGWADKAMQEDWYGAQDQFDLALPYVVEKLGWDPQGAQNWEATRHTLEHLLARYVHPGMRVLEVGAAKSWAGRYFIERGCEYVGSDILDDPYIGVGRSRFFGERFGYYEGVVADGESLPVRDNHFDLVFAIAALHHALDLDKMVREMARVTRPGGSVIGLNEGTRALWASVDADSQATEKTLGINEHVHTLWGYIRAFQRSGLRVREITRAVGYDELIAPRLRTVLNAVRAVPLVGETLAPWLLFGVIHKYDGVSIFAEKPK